MRVAPETLHGDVVRLEPLASHHAAGLHCWADEETFRYFNNWKVLEDPNEFRVLVGEIAARREAQHFAIVFQSTGLAIGVTALMDYRLEHRGVEIGSTWIGADYRGTAVNSECKLLLLNHAFEELQCERVQLKCDSRNLRSQAAISKLGAVREGILRKHMICRDGFVRDTVMYSIIREDWPAVRAGLINRLVSQEP